MGVMFFSSQVHQRHSAGEDLGQPRTGLTVEANSRGRLHGVVIPFGVGNPGVGVFALQNTEIGVEDVLDHHLMALADRWRELGN